MANKFIQLKANRIVDAEPNQDGVGAPRLIITTKTNAITIQPGRAALANGSDGGQGVVISGAANSAGNGGGLTLSGGNGSSGNQGGAISITAGGSARANPGANVTIAAGDNTNASGTPGDLVLKGGTGTGAATGLGGNTLLQIGGLSNSTGKIKMTFRAGGVSELEGFQMDNLGNVILHGEATTTSGATAGFLYLKGSSGRPTGTPTVAPTGASTGISALRYDFTNQKLYITKSTNEWKPLAVVPQEFDAGNSGTAKTIDWDKADAQKLTLTDNVTLTLSNPFAGAAYVLKIATGAGGFTVTWPASVKWSGGVAPTITATASKVDLINLYYDGTDYYGSFTQNY